MNRLLLAAVFLLLQTPPPAHLPQQTPRFPDAQPRPAEVVSSVFGPATGTPERPSAVVGFIVGNAVEMKPFGKLSIAGNAAPDANTVYEIGSITKGLTAIVLADMVLAGEVSLHDTLDKFLPEPANYPEAIRTVTLLQLATHTSGLPRLPANLSFGMKDP